VLLPADQAPADTSDEPDDQGKHDGDGDGQEGSRCTTRDERLDSAVASYKGSN
jgi:hypothetical protein